MRILTFGDSITYGAWDTEGGWAERLKRHAHTRTVSSEGSAKFQVINLGVGGDTSTKILQRMESEIRARQSMSWPFVFVFAFGTNDERSMKGDVETPAAQFEENVNAIIAAAKRYTDKIVFLGIPPLGQPTIIFKDQEYSDARVTEYDLIIESCARAAVVEYVPIRPLFEQAGVEDLFSYDGLHPNDNGHEAIADAVKAALDF